MSKRSVLKGDSDVDSGTMSPDRMSIRPSDGTESPVLIHVVLGPRDNISSFLCPVLSIFEFLFLKV